MEKVYRKHHMTVIGWLWAWKVSLNQYIVKDIALYIAKLLYNEPIDVRRVIYYDAILIGTFWKIHRKRFSRVEACARCLRPFPCLKHPYEPSLRQTSLDERLNLKSIFTWFDKDPSKVKASTLQTNNYLFVDLPNVYETIARIEKRNIKIIVTTNEGNLYKYDSTDTVFVFN